MTRGDLRRWAAVLVVLLVVRAAPVRADAAAAEVLIQQGLKLRREGKPEEALERFRQAHDMAPSPRTYGQMGLVEATLKHWTDGETHLAVALANPDDAWVHKNRAFLDQALSLCRQHIGDLVITGPAGAEVAVAGIPAGMLPAVPALRIAEGTVEVTATASGYEPFKESVSVHAGKRTALKIAMSPEPVAAGHADTAPKVLPSAIEPEAKPAVVETNSSPESGPAEESHWRVWTGVTLGVVGAAAVALGVTWIVVDGRCEEQVVKNGGAPECKKTYATKVPGWISAGVGAAALITGAVILFGGPSKNDPSVALVASPTSLGLAGRF